MNKVPKIEEMDAQGLLVHLLTKLERQWEITPTGWIIYVWSFEDRLYFSLLKQLGHKPRIIKNKRHNLVAIKINEP